MIRRIFIDTSFFLALANDADPLYLKANSVFTECIHRKDSLYTSDHVFDELITFMRCKRKESVEAVVKFVSSVELSEIRLFGIDQEAFIDALLLMKKYHDHYFSMTDCLSFIAMKELKTKDVLTLDKDFMIAGFNDLMRLA